MKDVRFGHLESIISNFSELKPFIGSAKDKYKLLSEHDNIENRFS